MYHMIIATLTENRSGCSDFSISEPHFVLCCYRQMLSLGGSSTGERDGHLTGTSRRMAVIQEYNHYRSRIGPLRATGVLWKKALAVWMAFYWLGRWVGSADMREEGRDKSCPKHSCQGHEKAFLDICLLNCFAFFFWMVVSGYWDESGERCLAMKI